jgi:hypothetical protein
MKVETTKKLKELAQDFIHCAILAGVMIIAISIGFTFIYSWDWGWVYFIDWLRLTEQWLILSTLVMAYRNNGI